VALVDADPHGEGIHTLLKLPQAPGLLDFVRSECDCKAVVQPTQVPGLSFVPIGTAAGEEDGLMLRPALGQFIQTLRTENDFVILDGPSILAADAAALLVPHSDAVLVVARPFHTRARLVRQALDMLYQRQAAHVGIVLNQARADDWANQFGANGNGLSRKAHPGKTNGATAGT
jgi:Mrp family chromosome partitioning ATPase